MVILANSPSLKVALRNGVSVTANPAPTPACRVVPYASMPIADGNPAVPAKAALLAQLFPVKLAPAPVVTTLTTTELGRTPVSVLLTKS